MTIVISFDGLSDKEFEAMAADPAKYPAFAAFMAEAQYFGGVPSVFVTNTYPIHTSVITGKLPAEHGIISNFLGRDAEGREIWAEKISFIKEKTIFCDAAEKGLKVATISWPVTCGAGRKIKWNLPEAHILPGQSRLWAQMRNGSPLYQFMAFVRHGRKLDGLKEPQLDDFLASMTVDLLRRKRPPDLLMVHLLAYDIIRHKTGLSPELEVARASFDKSLGRILAAAPKNAAIIAFSDHAHLDVKESVDLSKTYGDALFEQCGGSAFFSRPVEGIEAAPWFNRFLTPKEMETSGYTPLAVQGVAAKPGFCFGRGKYAANHGYPADYADYQVFIAVKNGRLKALMPFGDIRDVYALMKHQLSL